MKITKLYSILFLFLGLSFLFATCEKEEEYNYDAIIPVVKSITGTAAPMQGRYYEYSAPTRGGSTFEWESALDAEIIPIATATGDWKTTVYFPKAIAPPAAAEVITVTETTMGGKVSEPKNFTLATILPFTTFNITGSTLVNAGFSSSYSVTGLRDLDKAHSTFAWKSTAGTITPSTTAPWTMSIKFTNEEVGEVEISFIETNDKGLKDTSVLVVDVLSYCPLLSNESMVGSWTGTDGIPDGFYDSEIVTSDATETGVTISGINAGWIVDWWGEAIIDGGSVTMIINEDGTVEIENQYLFTTDYNGDPYEYWIEGEGRWNNCGDYPTLSITYTLENKTDGYVLPEYYPGDPYFAIEIVMDGVPL